MNRRIFMIASGVLLAGFSSLSLSVQAAGDLVIVVNPESGVSKMTRDEVVSIFMGKTRKLSSGVTALPIDQMPGSASGNYKAAFYRELINKELAEVNSYWARVVFSGQGTPPRQADGVSEVVEIVSSNKGAIAYLPRDAVTKNLKVVMELGRPL